MLFDSLDKIKRNSIMSAILLVALILATVDIQPKTSNGIPLIDILYKNNKANELKIIRFYDI